MSHRTEDAKLLRDMAAIVAEHSARGVGDPMVIRAQRIADRMQGRPKDIRDDIRQGRKVAAACLRRALGTGAVAFAVMGAVLPVAHAKGPRMSFTEKTCLRLRMEQPDFTGRFEVTAHRAVFDYDGKPVDETGTFSCEAPVGGDQNAVRVVQVYRGAAHGRVASR